MPFGTELIHYAVGIGSVGVPGVPAGLGELWRPARPAPVGASVRAGDRDRPRRRADAAGARALPGDARAGHDDARGRGDLRPGGRAARRGGLLVQPELARAFALLADEGPRSFVDGTLGRALLALMEERGGPVTAEDLRMYSPRWVAPLEGRYAGHRIVTRDGPGV